VHLEFLTFTQSARVSKAFYYRPHLPSRRALQTTARIALSGHVPAIPAVETLDFSGVINSTRSYLTFLFRSSISPFIRCPLSSCSPRQSLPRLGGTAARDSDLGFGFWCRNRRRHALESRPNWYACFVPYFFSWSICCYKFLYGFAPVLIRSNSRNSTGFPFLNPFFVPISLKYIYIYIYIYILVLSAHRR